MADQPNNSNKLLGYLLGGLLIGPILAVGCPFLGLALGSAASTSANDYSDTPLVIGIIAGIAAPLLIPVPLLFRPSTRPWGVGILIGAALTVIVLGGLCAGFIYLLSQESA
jgi:hypothetical protein